MIFISSSSFFLPEYLTEQINNLNYNEGQFSYALDKNYVAALTIEEQKADLGSTNWIFLNRELAKSQWQAALKLGHWYQKSAEKDLNTSLFTIAIMWFEQAIRLHSQQAVVDLAQLYFQQGNIPKAQSTLAQLPELLPSNILTEITASLRIHIAIFLGDISLVKQYLNSDALTKYRHSDTRNLLTDISKYGIVKNSSGREGIEHDELNRTIVSSSNCITSLQLFATNLKHLKHLDQLIKAFKVQQPLAQFVCLPTPQYISIKRLDCKAQSKQSITCDEARWQHVSKGVNTRHIGLMLNKGGANVHLGILYFDAEDNAEVFSHEISHLLGFVDEYPLTQKHDNCQAIQSKPFSHNIAVLQKEYQGDKKTIREMILKRVPWANSIDALTPILQSINNKPSNQPSNQLSNQSKNKLTKQNNWRLGTPLEYKNQVGIYLSESCQNSSSAANTSMDYSAFKPLNRRTQLRYFAADFPSEYLTLIKQKPSSYLMPSFHYNIALALYQQGKIIDAKYWLRKAAQWEDNPLRKAVVLKGGL